MKKYEDIVFKLIRIQEPKGGQPLLVEEYILNIRRIHEMEMTEGLKLRVPGWESMGVDEALWRQITTMTETEVDRLFHWLSDNKSILRETIASMEGVDPRDINLRDINLGGRQPL